MKYENKDKVKNLCNRIENIEKKIDDLQKLKTNGALHIMAENSHTSTEVFIGQETANWVVSRAILKYKGMLLELHADLSKL
jgi:orotate phosphoribosyltransferase-like protein